MLFRSLRRSAAAHQTSNPLRKKGDMRANVRNSIFPCIGRAPTEKKRALRNARSNTLSDPQRDQRGRDKNIRAPVYPVVCPEEPRKKRDAHHPCSARNHGAFPAGDRGRHQARGSGTLPPSDKKHNHMSAGIVSCCTRPVLFSDANDQAYLIERQRFRQAAHA